MSILPIRTSRTGAILALILFTALTASKAHAATGDKLPDRILGQVGYTRGGANQVGKNGLNTPSGLAIDASVTPNRLYVADTLNNRVLAWGNVSTFLNGGPASKVFGQPDFVHGDCQYGNNRMCGPVAVAVDSSGNLYVADASNNRVLEYDDPFNTDTVTDRVFGQSDFNNNACNFPAIGASSLCGPRGVGVDAAGHLYIADTGNSRVLEFDTPLTDLVAERVFGQGGSFTNNICNQGNTNPTADTLCNPEGLAIQGTKLWLADLSNSRVLEYDDPIGTNNTTADAVIGQANLTSRGCDNGGISASALCSPTGVAIDSSNNLYVADWGNARVLLFLSPLTTNHVADKVIGQGGSFSNGNCNRGPGGVGYLPTAAGLCQPNGVAVDADNNLYVADRRDNRVTQYTNPVSHDVVADKVFGQPGFGVDGANVTSRPDLNAPAHIAVDLSATPNRIYVVDTENSRVLAWNNIATFTSGSAANLVLGQNDFVQSDCRRAGNGAVTANGLCHPRGIAVNSATGDVYVADTDNSRVVEYDAPFSNDTVADRVFGAADLTSLGCQGASAQSLCQPYGVALDTGGHLWVADTYYNRVMQYDAPMVSATAAKVFGQGNNFSASSCNQGNSAPAPGRLCYPHDVALDANWNLFVADYGNNRVLEFDTPLGAGGDKLADHVFGQGGSFTTSSCNKSGINKYVMCQPGGLDVDGSGNLWVADTANDRVLRFNSPLSDQAADTVIGQTGFTTNNCPRVASADSLCQPDDVAVDANGNVFVGDHDFNRVLEYDKP